MYWTVVVDSARLLPAAFTSLLFASLFAALRVPAMPFAVSVGFVCGIALVGPCPHLARFQSFVLISLQVMMTIGVLVATRAVAGKRPMTGMLGCCCGAAIMLVTAAALSYLFMRLRLQAAAAQAAALCVFGFHALQDASAATACKYVLSEIGQRASAASAAALHLFGFHTFLGASAARGCKYILCEVGQRAAAASAAPFSCKNPEILLGKEQSEFLWFSSGLLGFLEWCLAGKSGMLEFVNNFSQFGKGKEKRFTLLKVSSKHDDLQASTPADPGNFVIFKGWDGHSKPVPGSGAGERTGGRPRDSVDAALLHKSPQCEVLANQGFHVEKKEKTVFVKGVEGRTRVGRVLDSMQIWELLDDGINMWVAVNGKRVDVNDTVAKIGIHDQDTIRCYGRLLGEGGKGGSTVQTTTTRHSGLMDLLCVWARTGVANECSLLSVRKSEKS